MQSVEDVLSLLVEARVALPSQEAEREHSGAADGWDLHDLLFHARSRFGRHDGSFAGTFRRAARGMPAPPAVKPPGLGRRVTLMRPSLDTLAATDPNLVEVMERRSSIRDFADTPLPFDALSTWLFRVARVRGLASMEIDLPGGRSRSLEVSSRPYPAGGRAYELELYLAVRSCEGLDPGMYHYDPLRHELEDVGAAPEAVSGTLGYACICAGIADPPQCVIVVASRLARLAWKYDAIGYAATLKHVGVLYEAMYLVATAMGLAPCALGSGDIDAFARATGLDPLEETSVGEFMLGVPAASAETNHGSPAQPDQS
jgi:SagB-type dehydrogenase family enzyme